MTGATTAFPAFVLIILLRADDNELILFDCFV